MSSNRFHARRGGVDGRLVVVLVLGGALLLWTVVFLVGLKERDRSRAAQGGGAGGPVRDSTAHPDTLRSWIRRLPAEWTRVTWVEGQGYVVFVPCYSANGTLALRVPADSLPQVDCDHCDSLGSYAVLAMARIGADSAYDLHLNPPVGSLRALAVTDSLLKVFPEAPFRERLLLWTRSRAAAEGGAPTGTDTMVFVPKTQEGEFEVLRAEDENPEGCGQAAE